MQRFLSKFQKSKSIPQWALERIQEAKEKTSNALDLSVEPLYSRKQLTKFPHEILELPELTSLDLRGNQLGNIPESITRLQNLTTLDLSFNPFRTFPKSITRLRNLTTLDLSSNGLSAFPELLAGLQNLTTLDLSFNQLSTIPESLVELQNLTTLNLSSNGLSAFPESLTGLQNLTTLDLSSNRLSAFPESIGQLHNLTTLILSGNGLNTLPESITRLQNLTTLNLSGSGLSAFPELITRLQNLTTLNLSGNGLSTLSEAITRLQNLTTLYLSNNQFSTFPESLTGLRNLTTLDLSSNQISTIPESITELHNLTHLDLGISAFDILMDSMPVGLMRPPPPSPFLAGNQLGTVSESITQLQKLTILNLSGNQLSILPESITQLRNLTGLNLSYNRLSALPDSITQLQNLTALNLKLNGFSSLPASIAELPNLTNLDLGGNPLISPPIEIASQGIKAIREYFRQLDQAGVDYLYEAKLLILGEGGAGKTTLANKLLNPNYALREEKSTAGVDVLKWSFPIEGNRQFTANIWDFGGQEIYHATHQFFLTRRSLYALVADTRKEDTDFYYWLNIAELLSDGSPLLIIKNEKQDRHREINERALKGQFDSLKEVLATNLATNRGLEEVEEEIEHYIRKLPHIGTPLPRTWVRVREQLEKDPRNYISLEEYLLICKDNGFAQTKDGLQLSGYLNDIGVFLHFQDEALLRKTVILKPKWGTDAVYKVLDNTTVIQDLGRFTRADLDAIWDAPAYEAMQDELLQLMMKFKLCYEIPTQRGTYIAPQLLTENQPDYAWDERDNLLLRYSYEFMPKGILTQFIVVMHPYIREQRIVWKSGVVIEKDDTRAEVIEYYGKREIHVRVAGPQARDLLTVIRHELKQIHDTYRRLKYDELVRCNCSTCKDSHEPHFYALAKLLEFRAHNHLEIQCQKPPFQMVNVLKLLGDTIDLSEWSEKDRILELNIENYYATGDNQMTKITQTIKDSTVHGSVVAAESIKDSFNTIQSSNANDSLKETLTQLTQAVEAMAKELPKERAEEVADDMKRLAEEATKEKPNARWYSVSIDGLIAAAQNIGKVGEPVIELAGKALALLTAS